MKKVDELSKKTLRDNYEEACQAYINRLATMWDLDLKSYGFWVGEEVGGIYCYGDIYIIDMEDIIYCVENDIDSSEYIAHTDYCSKCMEYNFNKLSLKSWHEGAPRIESSVFEKLDAIKKKLEDEIEIIKQKY